MVELAEVIQGLREELERAIEAGDGRALRFELGPIELEVSLAIEAAGKGGAKVRFWVAEVGAQGNASRTSTEPFSSGDLAGLQDVDSLGDLAGAPRAAAEFAQDSSMLELGAGPLTGRAEPGMGGIGSLLRGGLAPAFVRSEDVLACAGVALVGQHD